MLKNILVGNSMLLAHSFLFTYLLAKQHVRDAVLKLGQTDGLIYLLGQPEVVIEDSDAARPWRQRRYFYYCSGVDVPNCHLVYDIVEDKLVLYIPPIDEAKVVWSGRGPTIREAEDRYTVSYYVSL